MTKETRNIVIAGGTGLIGEELVKILRERGHDVRVLSRSQKGKGFYHWSPKEKKIDPEAFNNADTIINLAGAGIADKKWSEKRKKAIVDSRVKSTQVLHEASKNVPTLRQYISASGINCYGYDQPDRFHRETDNFGNDFLSTVVKRWEEAADLFQNRCKVTKVRTGVVLTNEGGALPAIAKTVKNYIGAPLGSGDQWMPWLTREDMVRIYIHLTENECEGTYNAVAKNTSNKTFTKTMGKVLKKPILPIHVPAFIMKLILGEMSSMLLQGLKADHSKLKDTGFQFKHTDLNKTLQSIYDN